MTDYPRQPLVYRLLLAAVMKSSRRFRERLAWDLIGEERDCIFLPLGQSFRLVAPGDRMDGVTVFSRNPIRFQVDHDRAAMALNEDETGNSIFPPKPPRKSLSAEAGFNFGASPNETFQ